MPRTAGVSLSSTECRMRRRPRLFTTVPCVRLNPVGLFVSVTFTVAPLVSVRWFAMIYAPAPVRSLSSLPRRRAIDAGFLSASRPATVARTTLCGFADPSDLVRMFAMPAASTTARTAPPAMMPVPSGAGFNSTLPAPKLPTMRCGMVEPCSGTRIRFFFAASMPFLIADGTSFALPTPKPTTPWPSPTTTSALKLRFLPPLTTLVTRLIDTTLSLMSSWLGSMRSRVFISCSEFQTGFAGGVGHGADAPVIQEAAAIEHDARDALFFRALGDRGADRFGALEVSALHALGERALQRRLHARRRRERLPGHIVDDLRVDMRHAAEHAEPRTRRRAGNPLALAQLDADAAIVFRFYLHPSALSLQPYALAPVLPAFFFSTSPV